MRVKRSLLLLAVGCGCLAFAVQATQKKYVILDDKRGGFKIYDVESMLGGFDPVKGSYSFDASGSPMRGYSKQQGLVFSMKAMDGLAVKTADGSFRMTKAKATGDVRLDVAKTNSDESTTSSHIESSRLELVESDTDATLTFPTSFVFTDKLKSVTTDRFLEVKAPGGTFVLPRLSQGSGSNNPFKSANVRGPLNLTIDSSKKEDAGTTRQVIKVTADRMTYDGATRTMRLEGNVVADVEITPAKGEPLGFVSHYEQISIEFDENSAVKMLRTGAGKSTGKGGGGL